MTPRQFIVVLAASLAFFTACSSVRPPAATVNGVDISNEHVASDAALFTTITRLAQQQCGQAEPGESARSACARVVLTNMIRDAVVSAYARAHDLRIDPAEVSRTASSLFAQLGGAQVVNAALRKTGIPAAAFRNVARRVVLFGYVQAAVSAELVTAPDVRAAYDADPDRYASLHAEHILVKTENEAARVYEEVTGPGFSEEDFLALAKDVSIDPSAQQNSGDLGSLAVSDLDPSFAQAALSLRPGEIARPVQTSFGWHVIRLVDTSAVPFTTVRAGIEQQLSQQAFSDWFAAQLQAATIEVNPRYGRWDAVVPGVVPITSTATGSSSPVSPGAASPTAAP